MSYLNAVSIFSIQSKLSDDVPNVNRSVINR